MNEKAGSTTDKDPCRLMSGLPLTGRRVTPIVPPGEGIVVTSPHDAYRPPQSLIDQ